MHIADVSHFVAPGSPLDQLAAERSTTTYLVQRCYPMLPRVLSETLCSLNEHVERLAFSVVWRLDPDGHVLDEWMGRTVMRSCARLSASGDCPCAGLRDVAGRLTPRPSPQRMIMRKRSSRIRRWTGCGPSSRG